MPLLTNDLSDGFFDTLKDICGRLGCDPVDLLSVMMSESGVKAMAHNPNGDASGLIQFMPATLSRFKNPGAPSEPGVPLHETFRRLSAEEQLPFVEEYFSAFIGKGLTSAARLYQATFLPATLDLGSDPDTVIAQQGGINSFAVDANKVFDTNNDGAITVGELQAAIDRNTKNARFAEIINRLNGESIDETIDLNTTLGIQLALQALGFNPGGIDGVSGPATQKAIEQFQANNGLAQDGVVGPETQLALAAALDAAEVAHTS